MLTAQRVAQSPHFLVSAVECVADHRRWSAPEQAATAQIVLVRRGWFRLDAQGHRLTADPATGYLHRPGDAVRFAHPAGGDACTAIVFADDALTGDLAGCRRPPAVRVDARLELAHRMLLRAGPHDPDLTSAELVVELLSLALREQPADAPAPGREELADRAREAILAGEPGGLVALARLLQTTPSHLSRTFRHHVGMPLGRYRNRMRISRALASIDRGETDLARLAVTLGFSDQSHLTRTMRSELGHTPGYVRSLLASTADADPDATRWRGGSGG